VDTAPNSQVTGKGATLTEFERVPDDNGDREDEGDSRGDGVLERDGNSDGDVNTLPSAV
jgi:hypothetical protein